MLSDIRLLALSTHSHSGDRVGEALGKRCAQVTLKWTVSFQRLSHVMTEADCALLNGLTLQ